MSEKERQFEWSYTKFLVDAMREIYQDADEGKFKEALDDLYWLIPFLDADIQEALKEEERMIEEVFHNAAAFVDPDPYMKPRKALFYERVEARRILRQVLKKIMVLLHKAGYFRPARTGMYFPAGYRKSGDIKHEGFPEVMSSEVK